MGAHVLDDAGIYSPLGVCFRLAANGRRNSQREYRGHAHVATRRAANRFDTTANHR